MKKRIVAILCILAVCGCAPAKQTETPPPASPAAGESTATPVAVRKIISPVGEAAAYKTVLAETSTRIDGEFADITLSTDAERGADGYMMWDDSQSWALTVKGKENYTLFDERLGGRTYFDVTREGEDVVIMLYTTSTVGTEVTKFTAQDGVFYSEKVINAPADGNNIYNSFPEYFEQ